MADLGGHTMLRRTHDVALRADCGPVFVLTDSPEVAEEVGSFGGRVIMTDPDLDSGTARIASVVDRLPGEIVVNLQGDAPLTDPRVLAAGAEEAARTGAPVTMPIYRISDPGELHDPSVIKVVMAHDGQTLYVSRSPLPHVRDVDPAAWPAEAACWAHTGIYIYSRAFLEDFGSLPASPLERAERLEQLRWLQAGVEIQTLEVDPQGPSVDTQADLEHVRAHFEAARG